MMTMTMVVVCETSLTKPLKAFLCPSRGRFRGQKDNFDTNGRKSNETV